MKNLLFLLCVYALFFTSCKKENVEPQGFVSELTDNLPENFNGVWFFESQNISVENHPNSTTPVSEEQFEGFKDDMVAIQFLDSERVMFFDEYDNIQNPDILDHFLWKILDNNNPSYSVEIKESNSYVNWGETESGLNFPTFILSPNEFTYVVSEGSLDDENGFIVNYTLKYVRQ